MSTRPLRVGLIGCGGIAATHLHCYQHNPNARVVAVADLNEGAATALAEQADARAYTDYPDMLARETLDAVGLLTPPSSHHDIGIAVLEAGVPLLCEKPLAATSTQARAMADTARKHDTLLLVAQCHRFHEPVRRARRHVLNGDVGQVSTYRNRFGYSRGTPTDRTRGRGGILLDNGSHSSYLFRYLVGPVRQVTGWAPPDQLGRIEDLCVCTLLLEADHAAGTVELDGAAKPCPNVIEVFGTEGSLLITYDGSPSLLRPASGEPVSLDDPSLPPTHRFQREVDHFLACVLGEEEPEVPAAEGVADLCVLEAAYESMSTGKGASVTSGAR